MPQWLILHYQLRRESSGDVTARGVDNIGAFDLEATMEILRKHFLAVKGLVPAAESRISSCSGVQS